MKKLLLLLTIGMLYSGHAQDYWDDTDLDLIIKGEHVSTMKDIAGEHDYTWSNDTNTMYLYKYNTFRNDYRLFMVEVEMNLRELSM